MKILLTGAHFMTAVAVIEELKKNLNLELIYVGRNTTREGDSSPSNESQILPQLGVKFIPLTTGRLQRTWTIYTIPSLFKIPIGIIQSFFIILREKPDIIVSFGGYVAVPLIFISWLFSIPILIHEQTLVRGLATSLSSIMASKIALSFPKKDKSEKEIITGNPIRKDILSPVSKLPEDLKIFFMNASKENKPVIFITGGNQGSHIINLAVEEILDQFQNLAFVIHQTGDSKYHDFQRLEKLANKRYKVFKWVGPEMGVILSKTDLVVSRAGINSLLELAFWSVPTLTIPIPYLYNDEQNVNAYFFRDLGLTKVLPQDKLSGKSLLTNIKTMLKDLKNLKLKAQGAKTVVKKDAARSLALEILLLAQKD